MKRDLLHVADLTAAEIETLFALARRLKAETKAGRPHPLLAGRTLAMIFEKPSLRTRVTFEVGMVQLGGAAIHLAPGTSRSASGSRLATSRATSSAGSIS